MPLDGQKIGRYLLVRLIGSGGMGEVYLAEDTRINRQVAIKVIRDEVIPNPDEDTSQDANRLFEREAKAIARLNHSHILPLFDYGEDIVNGSALTYMVMPYCQGGSLDTWLRQRHSSNNALSPQELIYLLDQAADALQYAHDQGLVHQDVKPSNFLIRSLKEASPPDLLLTDFGIAKFIAGNTSNSQSIRGTPSYMAPEQWESRPVPATDQYALGIMAYQLLTRHLPFHGGLGQMMYQHINVQPQPPSTYVPNLPADVDTVILHALAKKPEERFASISAFSRALKQALDETNIPTIMNIQDRQGQHDAHNTYATLNARDDIHAILAISDMEARSGTNRVITLPSGRKVSVSVPAGVQDGQTITLEGGGELSREGSLAGTLILTISVKHTEEYRTAFPSSDERTVLTEGETVIPAGSTPIPGPNSLTVNQSPLQGDASVPTPPNTAPAPTSHSRRAIPGEPFPERRASRGIGRAILLALLVLVLIAGSLGTYYLIVGTPLPFGINVNATASAQAQGTAQARNQATASTLATAANAQHISASATALGATATAQANPYPPNTGTLALDDPLRDNSKGYGWEEGERDSGSCTFSGGSYHSNIPLAGVFHSCLALATNFSDFAFEVQATIISGNSSGIVFRADRATTHLYYFIIDTSGNFYLKVYFDKFGTSSIVGSGTSTYINASGSNLIAVVARGSNIDLYVNQHLLKSLSDTTYSSGQVGVVALAGEVAFSNARVWKL